MIQYDAVTLNTELDFFFIYSTCQKVITVQYWFSALCTNIFLSIQCMVIHKRKSYGTTSELFNVLHTLCARVLTYFVYCQDVEG